MEEYMKVYEESIKKYISKELRNKNLSDSKKRELKIVRDLYISNKTKDQIYEKYNIERTTLWRMEKRFLENYSKREIYADIREKRNKLSNIQKLKIERVLKDIPFKCGVPYLEWEKELLKKYINHEFGVEYSDRQCYNIFKKYLSYYKTLDEEKNDIIKDYDTCCCVDIFKVANQSNKAENEKKRKLYGNKIILREINRNIFVAIAVSDEVTGVSKSFSTSDFSAKILMELLVIELKCKDKLLMIFEKNVIAFNDLDVDELQYVASSLSDLMINNVGIDVIKNC